MKYLVIIFILLILSPSLSINNKPIVGILTQPITDIGYDKNDYLLNLPKYENFTSKTLQYLNSDYVKWMEASGARVIPVFYDLSESELKQVFNSINGLISPGGSVELNGTQFMKANTLFFNWAIESFSTKNDYFPIFGTCQGFQILAILGSNSDFNVLDYGFNSSNVVLALEENKFFPPYKSRIFSDLSNADIKALYDKTNPITLNLHHFGVDYEKTWIPNKSGIQDFFNLVSTSTDLRGIEFLSTIESKKYPFYAVQFHPERTVGEWSSKEVTPHSDTAVRIVQGLGNFFVNEMRKNSHSFPSTESETNALIYNYCPDFTYKTGHGSGGYQQYLFPNNP